MVHTDLRLIYPCKIHIILLFGASFFLGGFRCPSFCKGKKKFLLFSKSSETFRGHPCVDSILLFTRIITDVHGYSMETQEKAPSPKAGISGRGRACSLRFVRSERKGISRIRGRGWERVVQVCCRRFCRPVIRRGVRLRCWRRNRRCRESLPGRRHFRRWRVQR